MPKFIERENSPVETLSAVSVVQSSLGLLQQSSIHDLRVNAESLSTGLSEGVKIHAIDGEGIPDSDLIMYQQDDQIHMSLGIHTKILKARFSKERLAGELAYTAFLFNAWNTVPLDEKHPLLNRLITLHEEALSLQQKYAEELEKKGKKVLRYFPNGDPRLFTQKGYEKENIEEKQRRLGEHIHTDYSFEDIRKKADLFEIISGKDLSLKTIKVLEDICSSKPSIAVLEKFILSKTFGHRAILQEMLQLPDFEYLSAEERIRFAARVAVRNTFLQEDEQYLFT